MDNAHNEANRKIGVWRQEGYENFREGTFGNGGQNLYVSRNGVLQRIRRFDFNSDGYVDLLFVNSQDMHERPPATVYRNPLSNPLRIELTTLGAYAGAVGDLNGDGYDDLVIANQCNGTHSDLTAFVYYGSPEGLSERYKIELPVPDGRAVAIGDFNGDGRPDLAFASRGKLLLFYQAERGFEPGKHTDLPLDVTHMAAADLDGDGCAELYVRVKNAQPRILWGSAEGIAIERCTLVGGEDATSDTTPSTTEGWINFVEGWTPRVLLLDGTPHLFRQEEGHACFYPVARDRTLGASFALEGAHAVSAAAGDVNGDGIADIVLACCQNRDVTESSWVYWGGRDGYANTRRTALPTTSARDVVVADLDGDSYEEVIVCQGRTDVMNTTESLVYRGSAEGICVEPLRFETHDATGVFVARTCDDPQPQLVCINHVGGRVRGDVPAYIYWNGPDGFHPDRRTELPGWSAPDALCCDFNDDGWADIFIGNCAENAPHLDPGSFLYWGGPEGFSTERMQVIPTVRAHGSAVGDFRHCGYLDLVVGGFAYPELLVFRGGPEGLDLANPQRIFMHPHLPSEAASRGLSPAENEGRAYREVRGLFAADFNNDGWLDLFVSQIDGPRSFILWGGPEGFSMERATWLTVEGADRANAADLTSNGYLDLIIGGFWSLSKRWKFEEYLTIYWGGPDGFREDRKAQLPLRTASSVAVADFNNDGLLDIYLSCYNAGRDRDADGIIYWGMPGGHFSVNNRTRLFGHSGCGCLAADFNEDGWVDLAVAHHKTYGNHVGWSKIWWNGPDGFEEKCVTRLPTLGPHGMLSVDPGNIMDRGPEEYFISSAHELPDGAKVTAISWEAQFQAKTWVRAQLRFAATADGLAEAPWQGPDGTPDGWFEAEQRAKSLAQTGRWIQYRLALGAVNGGNSPRVTAVSVCYTWE